jgi:AbrB family looped-hinge helix DNA binding protein
MPTSTVTSKGQITIPARVRKELGLEPGSRIDFVKTADGVYELVPATQTITSLKGFVTAPTTPITLAEIDDAIAAAAIDRNTR